MSDERYKLRSANVIVLSFAFVSREIFWRNCFAPPCLLRTGGGGGQMSLLRFPSVTPL